MKSNGATRLPAPLRWRWLGRINLRHVRTMSATRRAFRSAEPPSSGIIGLANRRNFWHTEIATDRQPSSRPTDRLAGWPARKLKSETTRAVTRFKINTHVCPRFAKTLARRNLIWTSREWEGALIKPLLSLSLSLVSFSRPSASVPHLFIAISRSLKAH